MKVRVKLHLIPYVIKRTTVATLKFSAFYISTNELDFVEFVLTH